MDDTLNALSAEFRLNRGNRERTGNDIHFMVRRLIENIMARFHAAGTDMAALTTVLDNLGSNASDIASGISGVAPSLENTPQVPGADASGRIYPDGARGARRDGDLLNADGTARSADGRHRVGAPGHPQGDARRVYGSAHNPNEPVRALTPNTPSGEPALNADGTVRTDIAAHVPNGPRTNPTRPSAKA